MLNKTDDCNDDTTTESFESNEFHRIQLTRLWDNVINFKRLKRARADMQTNRRWQQCSTERERERARENPKEWISHCVYTNFDDISKHAKQTKVIWIRLECHESNFDIICVYLLIMLISSGVCVCARGMLFIDLWFGTEAFFRCFSLLFLISYCGERAWRFDYYVTRRSWIKSALKRRCWLYYCLQAKLW